MGTKRTTEFRQEAIAKLPKLRSAWLYDLSYSGQRCKSQASRGMDRQISRLPTLSVWHGMRITDQAVQII